MSSLRICLFTPNFYPALGGAEKDADHVAGGLTERGHDVTVLTQRLNEPPPNMPYRVETYRKLPKQNLWSELYGRRLLQLHDLLKFDVVLAFYSYPLGYAAVKARRKLKCPVVLCPQGGDLYPNFHGLKKRRVTHMIRYGYANADRLIPISQWMLQRMREVTDDRLPPYDLVYNGIDVEAFQAGLQTARDRTPALVEPPFLLHLGRVAPVKRPELAIQAVAHHRKIFEQRNLRYAVVGEGSMLQTIEQQVEALNLGGIVKLLGTRRGEERDWLYANAMGFVSTSREEGLSNVSLEAMAAGLPFLASDIGPHRELLTTHNWGMMFQSENLDDLCRVLPAFLDSDLQTMSQAALASCQNYTLSYMVDGYEQSLRRAIDSYKD